MPKDIDTKVTPSAPSSSQAQPLEGDVLPAAKELAPLPADHLPANVRARRSRRWRWIAVAVLLAAGAAGGGIYWKYFRAPPWPTGIVFSNGRVEAEEIDIDAKFAERVAQFSSTKAMSSRPVKSWRGWIFATSSFTQQSRGTGRGGAGNIQRGQGQCFRHDSETETREAGVRSHNALVARGFATYELLDQRRRRSISTTKHALEAANNRAGEADRALDAAKSEVELYKVNIADDTLVSPTVGRIQYRISNVGEVFPRAAKSSRCSTSPMSIWTSICRPRMPAARASATMPHRAGCLSEIRHPRACVFHRDAGSVHAQGRRDEGRARQADVPCESAHRQVLPGAADRPHPDGSARRRLCAGR